VIWFFVFFVVSGFCSVLYEIVWLRLAMAQFGVTSAMVSIVLSFFMAGLGLGSWLSGRLIRQYGDRESIPALRIYATTEFLIGASALLVPLQLQEGRLLLERIGLASSASYYMASGVWIAITLVPWCACMGATIPVAMLAIRRMFIRQSSASFSYLYLANVLGAVGGALLPPFLIEIFGFHGTLTIGMGLNYLLSLAAGALSFYIVVPRVAGDSGEPVATLFTSSNDVRILVLLFMTGLTSMAAEVVWIRQFTPYLGTMVYSFALILATYLACTFLGSRVYRRQMGKDRYHWPFLWALLALSVVVPLLTADPRSKFDPGVRVLLGVGPFSALLGFITPMLVDRWSGGDPDRAGRAYAINVLGCILGPLVSGFLLLPYLSERWALGVLSLPWLITAIFPWSLTGIQRSVDKKAATLSYVMVALSVILVVVGQDYEHKFPQKLVLRDSTATVIAYGDGREKHLLVNGVGMTGLSQITKMMAHLPLAFLDHSPKNALVICFGMGTSYRSLLSWGIPVTAVELVPSVPQTFAYFHADARQLLSSPHSEVVIDDGRRYLERWSEKFDVIVIDPPPPVSAAASSLLYSKEFYNLIRERLVPGGILQQWLPDGDAEVRASVTRALVESFPYVRMFAYHPDRGYHYLASDHPIPERSPEELVQRMPALAVQDMQEWLASASAEGSFSAILSRERSPREIIEASKTTPAMHDDRPINEYFLVRRLSRHDPHVVSSLFKTP
jgi:spermidine synthase